MTHLCSTYLKRASAALLALLCLFSMFSMPYTAYARYTVDSDSELATNPPRHEDGGIDYRTRDHMYKSQQLGEDLAYIDNSGLQYQATSAEMYMSFNRYVSTILACFGPVMSVCAAGTKATLGWIADVTTIYDDFQGNYVNKYVTDYRDDPFDYEVQRAYVNYDTSEEGIRAAQDNLYNSPEYKGLQAYYRVQQRATSGYYGKAEFGYLERKYDWGLNSLRLPESSNPNATLPGNSVDYSTGRHIEEYGKAVGAIDSGYGGVYRAGVATQDVMHKASNGTLTALDLWTAGAEYVQSATSIAQSNTSDALVKKELGIFGAVVAITEYIPDDARRYSYEERQKNYHIYEDQR